MASDDEIREGLRELDFACHGAWKLGQNIVVGWMHEGQTVSLCAAPNWRVLAEAPNANRILGGGRMMSASTFAEVCKVLKTRPIKVDLPFTIGDGKGEVKPVILDQVARRYAISLTEHRAVILFDIVGFSKVDPLEQVAQLASLEYSINSAAKKLGEAGLDVEIARSTTGDGFYVWNRARGFEADMRLYAALVLILADNAVARARGEPRLVPVLRTCYSIGSHYAYHQIEGTRPRGFEYLVGEVTIQLARLVGKAQPGQICIGRFIRPTEPPVVRELDTLMFLARVEKMLEKLSGVTIGGYGIASANSQLTGGKIGEAPYPVLIYRIVDKHGYNHDLFNARIAVRRSDADPIVVGLRPEQFKDFEATPVPYEIPKTTA
jgi:class 3 adenylate cyclase